MLTAEHRKQLSAIAETIGHEAIHAALATIDAQASGLGMLRAERNAAETLLADARRQLSENAGTIRTMGDELELLRVVAQQVNDEYYMDCPAFDEWERRFGKGG